MQCEKKTIESAQAKCMQSHSQSDQFKKMERMVQHANDWVDRTEKTRNGI